MKVFGRGDINSVKENVDEILTRKAKESFRLLSNLYTIMKNFNLYLNIINTSGIGIKIEKPMLNLTILPEGTEVELSTNTPFESDIFTE